MSLDEESGFSQIERLEKIQVKKFPLSMVLEDFDCLIFEVNLRNQIFRIDLVELKFNFSHSATKRNRSRKSKSAAAKIFLANLT